ncbi:MAG: hypothetical protein LBG78_08430 [Azoarcus sp.]|nr:hypothetical protein [Azoarcus sp.]
MTGETVSTRNIPRPVFVNTAPAVKPPQNARHGERSEAIHSGFWISRRLAARNNTTVGAGFKPAQTVDNPKQVLAVPERGRV